MDRVSTPLPRRCIGMLSPVLWTLSLVGCAATLEVDGFEVAQNAFEYDVWELRTRASAELGCPDDRLSFELLGVHAELGAAVPQLFAVSGCGGLAVYSRLFIPGGYEGEWELESLQRGRGASAPSEAGSHDRPCYGNGTCDSGLQCIDRKCAVPLRPAAPAEDR